MRSPLSSFLHYSENSSRGILTRDQMEEKYKWNLADIYNSDSDWEADFKWVETNILRYKEFERKLSSDPELLLACLKFDDVLSSKVDRLYLYAMLAKDSDMRVTKYQGMDDRIKSLYAKASTASSFIKPELLSMDEQILMEMINENKHLRIYKHAIEDLLRTKNHTLTKELEEILALSGEIAQNPYNTFSIFTNADIKFPVIKDDEDNNVEMSHARYYAALYSKDRAYRERAFKAYLIPYKSYVNTFSVLFNGNLKTNIFYANARKYKSAREASLNKNNIPLSVYDNLIDAAGKNLAPMYRWAEMKKKILGISELHPYDVYVTLFEDADNKKYPYDESTKIVLNSLQAMGSDYLNSLKTAFENRWIDVYETQAKKSGAYSSGTTFGVHPYVLLNWTDLLNDVFTLTHEMGHNMHSYYTGLTQPYTYANYSIFLAEVASTFNESLLLDFLISKSDSKAEKLYLLEKYLNNITSTFYRQVMFAEFEMQAYDRTEKGEALTQDVLSKMYKEIYQKYWGPAMVVDEEEEFTWARVPHFYYNFYVYQYATGFAASQVLANLVKNNGKEYIEKYLNFLKAGSSDYPINILKKAGVDMNSPEPVLAVTKKMNEILDEMELLLNQ
ncbi:MAG: oligoendopeptidase F [Ignavibacterium sp.]|nr:oligoendopeptidase F [Ignavibacterium sp.]